MSINKIEDLIVIKEDKYQKDILNNTNELRLVEKFFCDITCGDKEVEKLLFSAIGYSLTKTSKFAKAFIFKGKARNGKSCIFRIIEAILSNDDYIKDDELKERPKDGFVSHEHLERLSGSKAGSKNTIGFLKGCTVNIAEDQTAQFKYINTGSLTKLISGEPIAIGQIGKEKEDFTPYTTMLFSVNEVIDFKEYGLNIKDRFIIIEFKNTFIDGTNRDINIVEEICQDIPLRIIIYKAIEAFKEANDNGKFSIPASVEESTKNYFMDCNEVLEFSNLYPVTKLITKSGYYKAYKDWCNSNNKEVLSNASFGKRVMALGYNEDRLSFAGKRETYYVANRFSREDIKNEYNKYLSENCISNDTVKNCSDKILMEKHDAITWNEYQRRILYGEPTKQN